MPSEDDILNALKAVKYPGYSRDIVSFGIVKDVAVANGAVSVGIHLTSANADLQSRLQSSEASLAAFRATSICGRVPSAFTTVPAMSFKATAFVAAVGSAMHNT